MKKIFLSLALMILFISAFSQETPTRSDTLRKDALNVFMTASDYIKKEIPYVNYVRDIKDAGVYIISTAQGTGSGGYEFTYFLVGQHQYAGMRDTVTFVTSPDETQDEIRIKEVRTLKMGMMRYIARTPLAKYMNISFSEPLSETVSSDKWDSWVFSTSIYGYMQGQKTYKQSYVSGNLSANRITKDWKINMRASLSQNDSKNVIDDTTTINSGISSKSVNALIVKSLSDHWSAGGTFGIRASTYNNEKFRYSLMPGIEYDVFPYSESTRRQLRILYTAGFSHVNYVDSTIYDKINENLWSHSLSASYEVVQKWGNINISVGYNNYFHDWTKNNLFVEGFVDLRIAKGLNINIGGSAALVHDQLGLVKGDITLDQKLLQRKQLATKYEYFTSFGLTYTFGSIYNNVVNPRFGRSGGGGMTISIN